jgi:hypothetical protein
LTKSKPKTYQYWMFAIPVANRNPVLETSSAIASRSIPSAGVRTGGHWNSRGITDHSFASSTGSATSPTFTWSPWVSAYSQDGPVGQSKNVVNGRSGSTSALRPRSGW